MTKYGWRESTKSLPGSHIDPEKDEQLKGTEIEIEDNVTKILKLIKNEDQDGKEWNPEENSKKESELVELIEDFHKQYQSLYALYDHLRGELRENVQGGEEKESSSSSTSSSDSEYYSLEEVGSENGKLKSEHQTVADSIKQELETANLEVTDLKHKLASTSEEKEALDLEYKAALSKKQESEKIINDLMIEVEQRQKIIQKLMDESSQLKEKLGEREREVVSSAEMHEVRERKTSAQIMELEDLKRELEERIESKTFETEKLGEENLGLQARILELEMISKEKGDELSAFVKKLEDNESNSLSKFEDLMAQISNLQLEVDSLRTQKGELEEVVSSAEMHEVRERKTSAQIMELEDQKRELEERIESKAFEIEKLGEENLGLQARILELEMISKEKGDELSAFVKKLEDNESNSMSKFEDLMAEVNNLQLEVDSLRTQKGELEEGMVCKSNEASTQVKGLMDQVNAMQQELESLNSQKTESESQIERKTQEILRKVMQVEALKARTVDQQRMQDRIFELEKALTERDDDFSALQKKLEDGENEASARFIALLDSLQAEKSQLELQIEREKQESSESLIQVENQKTKLTSMIAGQERTLEEREDIINKLSKEYEQVKGGFQESKLNLQIAERKMEELEKLLKEKDEGMLGLGEEKREAIRQLCVSIDYHRSQCDHLKELISKMTVRSRRTP